MSEIDRREFLLRAAAAGGSLPLFMGLLESEASAAPESDIVDIQIGLANVNLEYAGFIVASHLNLFKKYKVRPHVTLTGTSTTAVQGLVSGSLNIASITTDSAILAELAAPSISIVQAITRSMPLSLITSPSIKTPADCKGKVFGASNTTTADAYIIIKMLDQYGLKVGTDFTVIAAGAPAARTAALQSGQIAGIAVVEPQISALEALGYNNLISGPDVKVFQHWPHVCLMANNSWAAKNPTVLQNYIKATLDGVRIALDPKRKKQVEAAFAGATADTADIESAYQDWVVKVKPWSTTGEVPSSGLQLVIQSLIETGGLSAPGPNPANLINSTYVHAAIKQPFLTKL